MANSSYSWWSAWLKDKDKNNIITAPKYWYKGKYFDKNTDDIYCDDWYILDSYLGKLLRKPVLNDIKIYLKNTYDERCNFNNKFHKYLGPVFVIGLNKFKKERGDNALNLLKNLNIESNFFNAVYMDDVDMKLLDNIGLITKYNDLFSIGVNGKGQAGCLLSHTSIWNHAFVEGYDSVTIFEDDITSYISTEDFEKILKKLFENIDADWDVIFLGRCIDKCSLLKNIKDEIYQTFQPSCGHAYILSKKGLQKIFKKFPIKSGVDTHLKDLIYSKYLKAYTIHPSIFQQDILKYSSNLRSFERQIANAHDCMAE